MKILAVSDRIDPRIYNDFCRERFKDVECVISCGDLPEHYLDFIVTNLNVPLFFVHGNHDYSGGKKVLAGGTNLDEKVITYRGVIIAGLEGSYWYNGGLHQYTEREMYFKYLRLLPKLWWSRIHRGRFLDILVTHAPPQGVHEGSDLAHRGFSTFTHIIQKYRPRYHLHGHVHIYDRNQSRESQLFHTTVVNCYTHRIIEINPAQLSSTSKVAL
ncbi:MAG TPA: metallophosphoesterase [Candidatus Atribacteria bacterium]|nr:metallophosphoesterase [Candidatus Atribacteria bacterium]